MTGNTETMRSFAANRLGVGLPYTRPRADLSYDGKPVRHIRIIDAAATEPIMLVHHRDNSLSTMAQAAGDVIAAMGAASAFRRLQ